MIFTSLSKRPILVLLILILLIGISVPFQNNIDTARAKFKSNNPAIYLNSSILSKVSLGYRELLADIYWLRALQYFGSEEINIKEDDSTVLYNYFDILTDLDPKFVNAYRYGGTFLAEPYPFGFGDFESGTKLLDKGRENNPDNFRIPFEEAFLYYIYEKNYQKAAELFNEASEKPGLSDFRRASIKGMAGSSLKKGGDRELSKQIWQEIYDTTQNEKRKRFALNNLKELNTRDFEDRLTLAANQYEERFAKFPNDLNDLVESGYLKKIPTDHNDGEFIVVPEIKSIKSTTILKADLKENLKFLNAKSRRYMDFYGKHPENIDVLKKFIIEKSTADYPENPFGEKYNYDPETGTVSYKSDLID